MQQTKNSHDETRKTWKASGASVLGRHNSRPLTRDLAQRSRDGTQHKRKKEEVKQSCFFGKRVNHEPGEVGQLERKNTMKMNKVENTPIEKRNKKHYENLEG